MRGIVLATCVALAGVAHAETTLHLELAQATRAELEKRAEELRHRPVRPAKIVALAGLVTSAFLTAYFALDDNLRGDATSFRTWMKTGGFLLPLAFLSGGAGCGALISLHGVEDEEDRELEAIEHQLGDDELVSDRVQVVSE